MSTFIRLLLPAAVLLVASGCMSTYQLPKGAPSASLRVAADATSWICISGERMALRPAGNGRALIPSGERVTLGVDFTSSDGYTRETCTAAISVAPDSAARYYQDFEYEGSRCRAMVYRETEDQRVGLAFEPSVGQPGTACLQ